MSKSHRSGLIRGAVHAYPSYGCGSKGSKSKSSKSKGSKSKSRSCN